MRTVELEDDIYFQLLGRATDAGSSISEIITSLLKSGPSKRIPSVSNEHSLTSSATTGVVDGWTKDTEFLRQTTALGRFMILLEQLYKASPSEFDKVTGLSGRKRRYIGRSQDELEGYGTSVYPKRIGSSPFWVVTNLENPRKKQILESVMRMLGYAGADVRIASSAI